jgi:NhaA family Na+:H+ antiporter
MATDIAFAIGVISLLGRRVPIALKVLLTAAAIVDDLGAVIVIAIFYTEQLNYTAFYMAGLVWLLALVAGFVGVRSVAVYPVLGLLMWYFTLQSGVHATVAGVLIAMTVPIRRSYAPEDLKPRLKTAVLEGEFESVEAWVGELERVTELAQSPLHRLEHGLHPWVTYLVLPIFALANAGVTLGGDKYASPIALGVLMGLLIGKPIGVLVTAWLAVRLDLARLPAGCDWRHMIGFGLLMGIGFTMSMFIATLAFPDNGQLDQAKVGLLVASVLSAILGLGWLAWASRRARRLPAGPGGL